MKVFFSHAAGTNIYNSARFNKLLTANCLEKKTIYLWSLKYEHEGRVYELWLEINPHLQPELEKRDEELLNIIKKDFCIKEEQKT